ncbi:hypothetical protein OE88DRAFT_1755903 [Heliocybe sulcata]|uniref:Uncharacterized protein n=1 Tax=Heliocybe sulcata TaxID=5364 RepID=A0A5C3N1B6_9AGAM|nr:hypothetical protein OE88DRAFT_1755903 [Heliocybe sulcata]
MVVRAGGGHHSGCRASHLFTSGSLRVFWRGIHSSPLASHIVTGLPPAQNFGGPSVKTPGLAGVRALGQKVVCPVSIPLRAFISLQNLRDGAAAGAMLLPSTTASSRFLGKAARKSSVLRGDRVLHDYSLDSPAGSTRDRSLPGTAGLSNAMQLFCHCGLTYQGHEERFENELKCNESLKLCRGSTGVLRSSNDPVVLLDCIVLHSGNQDCLHTSRHHAKSSSQSLPWVREALIRDPNGISNARRRRLPRRGIRWAITLPDAGTALIVFPMRVSGASEKLVMHFQKTHEVVIVGDMGHRPTAKNSGIGRVHSGDMTWYDRYSEFDASNPGSNTENKLLSLSPDTPTTVLNVCGLWGGSRHVRNWVGRVAPTKEALKAKKYQQVFFLSLTISTRHSTRWAVTIYFGPVRMRLIWLLPRRVRELMGDKGSQALPRSQQQTGRALDGTSFELGIASGAWGPCNSIRTRKDDKDMPSGRAGPHPAHNVRSIIPRRTAGDSPPQCPILPMEDAHQAGRTLSHKSEIQKSIANLIIEAGDA